METIAKTDEQIRQERAVAWAKKLLASKRELEKEIEEDVKTLEYQEAIKNSVTGMHKEGQKWLKYDFEFRGGKNNSYLFDTNHEITYEVKFKPSSYLFDEKDEFSTQVYEMVIAITERKSMSDKIPSDSLIMNTIADIVTDFFKNRERIIVYICDTADARHLARARKFGLWFEKFKTTQFIKVDASIVDEMGIIYMNALILHRENPYFVEIIDAFRKVTGGYTEDK